MQVFIAAIHPSLRGVMKLSRFVASMFTQSSTVVKGILIGLTIGTVFVMIPVSEALGLLTFLLGGILVYFMGLNNKPLSNALIIAFIIRVGLALIDSYVFLLPESGEDTVVFEYQAWLISMSDSPASSFGTGSRLYPWLISFLYRATDRSPLMMRAVNVVIGVVTVFLVYKTAEELWNKRTAVTASLFAALFPTLALRSAIMLRETFVVFFIALGSLSFVKWQRKNSTGAFLESALCFFAAGLFHTVGMFFLLGQFLILGIEILSSIRKRGGILRNVFRLIISAIIIVFVVLTGFGLDKVMFLFEAQDPEEVLLQRLSSARGRTSFPSFLLGGSSARQFLLLPIRTAYLLFSPFVWEVRSLIDLAGFFDALIFLVMFWVIYRERTIISQNKAAHYLLIVVLFAAVLTSLGTNNIGTALRHRGKLTPVLIVLTAYGIRNRFTLLKTRGGINN